ncbi:MAG TPA: alpha-L-rhamnosidase C-terminal domain-containing protein [Candidatus Acidoferrum sp.]|nr:alpha-L-rhamnosidase C-terminal domain-containing protein [Candidatus Acidoferrum sp.]
MLIVWRLGKRLCLAAAWTPVLLLALFFSIAVSGAQPKDAPDPVAPNPLLLHSRWPAHWIAPADASLFEYGVFLFRKHFQLPTAPPKFIVHISADNRYRLFVNGNPVCFGPQRGEPMCWHFDSIDLAPYLRAGDNVLAVQVWNYGHERPYALMSVRTGLIVQGDGPLEQSVNTGDGWRVLRDAGYSPVIPDYARLRTFIVVGPGDQIDAAQHPWGWEQATFDDSAWPQPRELDPGMPVGFGTGIVRWLSPRTIPFMAEAPQRFAAVRGGAGPKPAGEFLSGHAPWSVPPHTNALMLLDQGYETDAFPELVVSGGQDATVTLAYAEALVDSEGRKGNRNEINGRHLIGVEDHFRPDGGGQRIFTTLDFRCFRYVELRVETGAEPLTVEDLRSRATGYPFVERGAFSSDDPSLTRIWEVGWRTARLCAFETYMDCPYYERLQYVGDTRIQALISLYVSGDNRLMHNAITTFDRSRIPEGLTQSRYPTLSAQIISPFSLFWIGMVHDYWRLRDDPAFIAARLHGIEDVLAWFEERLDAQTGLLGPLPYWSFVDWPDAWPWDNATSTGGVPPGAQEGGSAIVTLQYAMALDQAAELFRAYGRTAQAKHYARMADNLRKAALKRCWDANRRLLADSPAKTSFSQHVNALAVLSGAVRGEQARDLISRTLADRSLVPCTLYFRFYLLQALKTAGLGDHYLEQLGPWRDMLDLGLTTFAERPEPTRSDCHAWSASPVYEFLATVCGVEPGSPGFKTVRIEPHPGRLSHLSGTVPHPAGPIRLELTRAAEDWQARVDLPGTLTGKFVWHGRTIPLHPGLQEFKLPAS